MKNIIITSLLLLTSFSACFLSKKNMPEDNAVPMSIEDNWVLQEMKNTAIDPHDFNQIPHLEINLTENTFNGNDGCNSYGGNLKNVTSEKITFSEMYSTEMYCDKMQGTKEYVSLLQEVNTYKIGERKLYLSDKTGKLLLTFYSVE